MFLRKSNTMKTFYNSPFGFLPLFAIFLLFIEQPQFKLTRAHKQNSTQEKNWKISERKATRAGTRQKKCEVRQPTRVRWQAFSKHSFFQWFAFDFVYKSDFWGHLNKFSKKMDSMVYHFIYLFGLNSVNSLFFNLCFAWCNMVFCLRWKSVGALQWQNTRLAI